MQTYAAEVLVDGLAFPEGPRWHESFLWFTDQHAHSVNRVSEQGVLEQVTTTTDLPGGLGWLPDGTLLVVYMTQRRIMAWDGKSMSLFADLSQYASFHCNDMLVDALGRVYVGNFGFDLHGGQTQNSAEIVMIDVDGKIKIFSDQVVFPNGSVITPHGNEMIVAETFAHRLTVFDLKQNGMSGNSEIWADLNNMTPDGICLDQQGAIWVASPGTQELIRVQQGGNKLAKCVTRGTPYACMLGGNERKTLYICSSETDDPQTATSMKSGRIEQVRVDVGGAGLP